MGDDQTFQIVLRSGLLNHQTVLFEIHTNQTVLRFSFFVNPFHFFDHHSEQTVHHSEQTVHHSKQTVHHSEQTVLHTKQTVHHTKQTVHHSQQTVCVHHSKTSMHIHSEQTVTHSKQAVSHSKQTVNHSKQTVDYSEQWISSALSQTGHKYILEFMKEIINYFRYIHDSVILKAALKTTSRLLQIRPVLTLSPLESTKRHRRPS